ncbi:ACP S-malonyltransferase [Sphaerotilus microaerophilus]|uniref:Malonate decarboxylase subunit epsilon n=1 Tax=Sphaerotilus microaerophilus TaxID=2914710 RepID=A0ABM7YND4_9BURK|nr:acyltransferase domain-containing protein [Sphaerotilus sp. FB-5]BDI06005.1 malonate decarboxylase subunit epsilon [Sphaerotilus sp. FB-5]
MAYALVFSGQGGQHAEMFRCLAAPEHSALVDGAVGPGWRERLHDPHWSTRNAVAQPLLTALAVATWQALRATLPPPTVVAGYSVGELAAFHAAGVIGAEQAVDLARVRAAEMDLAAQATPTALAGWSGLDADALAALCQRHGMEVAIRNAPDSVVVGGPVAALQRANGEVEALGAQASPLRVGLASHTRWMRPAAQRFAEHLAHEPMAAPSCRLATNHALLVRTAAEARVALGAQVATTVRWAECMDAIVQSRVDAVLEIGAGSALSRMLMRVAPVLPVRAVDDFRSLEAVLKWLMRYSTA